MKDFFCSRSCASKGSMTDKRLEKAHLSGLKNKINLLSCEEILRLREGWKYKLIEKILKNNSINYQFEYPINNYVYDLAILEKKLLFEFDGTSHNWYKQIKIDEIKNNIAIENGWNIIRIKVNDKEIIQSNFLYEYLK